jgi:hypothetical protein
MLNESERTKMFSIWENIKKEKEKAVTTGIASAQKREVLIVDGY